MQGNKCKQNPGGSKVAIIRIYYLIQCMHHIMCLIFNLRIAELEMQTVRVCKCENQLPETMYFCDMIKSDLFDLLNQVNQNGGRHLVWHTFTTLKNPYRGITLFARQEKNGSRVDMNSAS